MSRFWALTKWVWARLGDIFLAKDILLLAGPTVLAAVLSPVVAWWLTPASPVALVAIAASFALLTFLLAYRFASRHHFHSAKISLSSAGADAPMPDKRPAFETESGGQISIGHSNLPHSFPFTFGKAETGGRIIMEGVNIIPTSEGFSISVGERRFAPSTRSASSRRDADFEAWDRVQVLTLRQAAHLWSGERPSDTMEQPSQSTEIVLNELVDAAIAGSLSVEPLPEESERDGAIRAYIAMDDHKLGVKNSTADYNSHARITRENLRAYALKKDERPLFLFPEERLTKEFLARLEWLGAADAVQTFADSNLVHRWKHCRTLSSVKRSEYVVFSQELSSITSETRRDVAEALSARVASINEEVGAALDEESAAYSQMTGDVTEKLRAGKLIAKGFIDPYYPGAEEVVIRASEWRLLQLLPENASAVGSGVRYVGLRIGKAY